MSAPAPRKIGNKVLTKVFKGFLYGTGLGLLISFAYYLMAYAVNAISPLPVPPESFLALVFAACIMIGITLEYASWLDEQEV